MKPDQGAATALRAVASQRTHGAVLASAVEVSRQLLEIDLAFAGTPEDGAMRISMSSGASDPRFHQIRVAPGRGLGGQVLARKVPMRVDDYGADTRITSDFVEVVCDGEGLHGITCVPVRDLDGEIASLLYAARRGVGISDDSVTMLATVADYAEIGLRSVAQRAIDIERTQRRIANDLHVSVAQALFAIGVTARQSARRPEVSRRSLLEAMSEIDEAAAEARGQLRKTLLALDESAPKRPLRARLAEEASSFSTRKGCQVELVCHGEVGPLDDVIEDLCVDVLLEGLANAVKHQHAVAARALFEHDGHQLQLVVSSKSGARPAEGQGADSMGPGCGLELLRRRASRLDSNLELSFAPSGCVELRLFVPLD